MRIALLVVTVLSLALLAPVAATESTVLPTHLPLGPDASRFFFSLPLEAGKGNGCRQTVNEAHRVDVNTYRLYATNDEKDPCRLASEPAYGGAPHGGSLLQPQGVTHTVLLHPVAEAYLLEAGSPIVGKLVIEADRASVFEPRIVLHTVVRDADGKEVTTVVAAWNASEPLMGTAVTGGDTAASDEYTWEFDLGKAPARLEGMVRLDINLTRGTGGVRAASAIAYRIGAYAGLQSHLDLPLVTPPAAPPVVDDDVTITCPDGTNATDLEACPEPSPPPRGPVEDHEEDNVTENAQATPDDTTVTLNSTDTPKERPLPAPSGAFFVMALLAAVAMGRRSRSEPERPR